LRLSAECGPGIAAVRPDGQETGGAVGWIVDWLKRAVPLATGTGTADTTLPLETVVPADHPLRLARRALDEALALAADEVAKAAGRLDGQSSPGELAALLLLATLYDELLLAIKLELLFDKDELLELYLANAYFGAGVNGLELAARRYFGRRAPELAAHEAALLVSLLPSPETLRPDNHWLIARPRAIGLLRRTAGLHPELAATLAEAERRLATTAAFADLPRGSSTFRPIQHRYFRDWALGDVARHFPGATGEHRLVLTLDPLAQIYAQVTVERLIASGRQAGFDEAAVVVMDPDGTVRAMVGGTRYATSQFSRATQARRQPGSAFKPVVYLAALEAGLDAASIVEDRPFRDDGWPRNYRGGHQGRSRWRRRCASRSTGRRCSLPSRWAGRG
jgi:membrane carboxypeptidase/penicillin-binding protein